MNKNIIKQVSGLLLIFLISCSILEKKETPPPKVSAPPRPGDCMACHETEAVLPQDHIDTKAMMGNACGACHKPGPTSLWAKIPLNHIHQLNGISCKGCHEGPDTTKAAADSKVCQKCHNDTESLIQSANELEINPHFSPHESKVPDCNQCHHQHKSSENYCARCHGLEYKVP